MVTVTCFRKEEPTVPRTVTTISTISSLSFSRLSHLTLFIALTLTHSPSLLRSFSACNDAEPEAGRSTDITSFLRDPCLWPCPSTLEIYTPGPLSTFNDFGLHNSFARHICCVVSLLYITQAPVDQSRSLFHLPCIIQATTHSGRSTAGTRANKHRIVHTYNRPSTDRHNPARARTSHSHTRQLFFPVHSRSARCESLTRQRSTTHDAYAAIPRRAERTAAQNSNNISLLVLDQNTKETSRDSHHTPQFRFGAQKDYHSTGHCTKGTETLPVTGSFSCTFFRSRTSLLLVLRERQFARLGYYASPLARQTAHGSGRQQPVQVSSPSYGCWVCYSGQLCRL